MEQNKSLGLLSLARKGGNIVLGEEQAGAAARASRARLMLLASDAGGHTVRRAKSFVAGTAHPLLTLPYPRDELGDALGTTSCAIAARFPCLAAFIIHENAASGFFSVPIPS